MHASARLWETGKMSLEAVIFDYGKVLSLDQDPSDLAEMKRVTGLDEATFYSLYWKYRDDYDAGNISGTSYWETMAREAGVSFTPEQLGKLVKVDSRSWSHTSDVALRWTRELSAAGLKIGILSNMHKDLRDYLEEHFQWVKDFDYTVFSCDVRMVKPHAPIYRLVVEGLQVAPERAVFLDDKRPNIEAAEQAGIHGILVHNVTDAIREASERFGLPVNSLAAVA